jgi:hypothetical protein
MKILFFSFILLAVFSQAVAIPQPNILIYKQGNIQISSEIDEYEHILQDKPIKGSILITHEPKDKIDNTSFRIGVKELKISFVKSYSLDSSNLLQVSAYEFELPGMERGTHTLPPISVRVGGKVYQAPPMTVDVSGK